MKKLSRRIALIIGAFFIGFLLACHWDGARDFVQKYSPAYNSKVQKGVKSIAEGIMETGNEIKQKTK